MKPTDDKTNLLFRFVSSLLDSVQWRMLTLLVFTNRLLRSSPLITNLVSIPTDPSQTGEKNRSDEKSTHWAGPAEPKDPPQLAPQSPAPMPPLPESNPNSDSSCSIILLPPPLSKTHRKQRPPSVGRGKYIFQRALEVFSSGGKLGHREAARVERHKSRGLRVIDPRTAEQSRQFTTTPAQTLQRAYIQNWQREYIQTWQRAYIQTWQRAYIQTSQRVRIHKDRFQFHSTRSAK